MNEEKPKRGRQVPVTAADRFYILEKYAEGASVADIAKQMGRSRDTVSKTVVQLQEMTTKAFHQELNNTGERHGITPEDYAGTDVHQRVMEKLVAAGIDEVSARRRIAKVCNHAISKNIEVIEEGDLYSAALSTMSALEVFATNTRDKNNNGVVMATPAVSEIGDSLLKAVPTNETGKKNRKCTFPTGA